MSDFDAARRAAFMSDLVRLLRREPVDLLPFAAVGERLRLRRLVDRGLLEIPLDRVVGSLGRSQEFNRAFLPREESLRDRWQAVERLAHGPVGFAPIEVYQVGEAYFVVDGHHRVSVARRLGATTIEAWVRELDTRVPVTAQDSIESIVAREGLVDFLEATGLADADPDCFRTTLGAGYERLLEHIAVHRWFLGIERGAPVRWDEAVGHWREAIWDPVVTRIAESGICESFPGRTPGDLYLFTMDHLHRLRQLYGDEEIGPRDAIEALGLAHRKARGLRGRLRAWLAEPTDKTENAGEDS